MMALIVIFISIVYCYFIYKCVDTFIIKDVSPSIVGVIIAMMPIVHIYIPIKYGKWDFHNIKEIFNKLKS